MHIWQMSCEVAGQPLTEKLVWIVDRALNTSSHPSQVNSTQPHPTTETSTETIHTHQSPLIQQAPRPPPYLTLSSTL